MNDLLILNEKPSQYKHMAKALGGFTGTFQGQSYQVTHAAGHLFEMVMPTRYSRTKHKAMATKMLKDPSPANVNRYSSWTDMNTFPWNPEDFTWHKKLIGSFQRKLFRKIKAQSQHSKAIVIATDDDPDTKEGDLLGYEIVQQLHWTKPVYRIRFADETPGPLRKSLANKKNMKDQSQWGCYLKANTRSHFDYLAGLPLSRIATYVARKAGYNTVVNEGRLKSVILVHIYKRLMARKNYVKHPYYEVRFKDSAGHKYSRYLRTDEEKQAARHQSKAEGQQAMDQYHASPIGKVKKQRKTQAPGALLNLSTLASRLSGKYSVGKVLGTYEKLYEGQYVSYPRTADKKITQNDFNALLPKVDKIADVAGVDKSLLTHRSLRPKFRIKHEDHGANRPGPNVPKSLNSLARRYGACGADIYKMVAKNYLSIMGEDAVYDKVTANLKDYPRFTTSFRIPVKANWKAIYKPVEKKKPTGTADMSWRDKPAKPFLFQGANPKPSKPTIPWIMHYLQHVNVGTAATQGSTVQQLAKGGPKRRKLTQHGKALKITQGGKICAVMALGTEIGNADSTKKLAKEMDAVMNYQMSPHDLEMKANQLVVHDRAIMLKKVPELQRLIGKPRGKMNNDSFTVEHNGKQVQVKRNFMGNPLTDEDIKNLKANAKSGKPTRIKEKSKKGSIYYVNAKLGMHTYNGKSFFGVVMLGFADNPKFVAYKKAKANRPTAVVNGKKIQFNPKCFGNKITDPSKLKALEQGKTVVLSLTSKKGNSYKVKAKVGKNTFNGHTFYDVESQGFVD